MHGGVVFLCIEAHPAQRLEGIIRQHVDAAMVCLEIVDLFFEEQGPELFTQEFDDVERGRGAGGVAGETDYYRVKYGRWKGRQVRS